MMSDTICTGSHLNQRTFKEDEYWESFQSTLISGQILSADQHHDSTVDLSTMIEDEISEENTLNMNLDAISDADPDDMFFDCPSFEKSPANLVRNPSPLRILSPRPYTRPQFYTVQFSSPPENDNNSSRKNINCEASPRKQRPESSRRISPARTSATSLSDLSSSPSHAGMRTGSLLVQIAQDFNDLQDHAQSTPKLSSDSGNPSSGSFSEDLTSSHTLSSVESVRKTLDFQNADTIVIENKQAVDKEQAEVSISNKENFFNGKYSKFVAMRRGSEKASPLPTRAGKVKLLAGFFQSFAMESANIKPALSKSRIPLPVRKSSQLLSHVKKSPQAKSRASGSPTYQTRKSYKLLSSRSSSSSNNNNNNNNSKSQSATAMTFTSSGSESFLTRNQRKFPARTMRIQSCSDATNAEIKSIDETCKSHSDGDLRFGTINSSSSIKSLDLSQSNKRTYLITKKKSPMNKLSPKKKISAINNRRSVGAQLKKNISPVKPVKELCKLFTPKRNAGKKIQNSLVIPKIVITHH